MYLQKARETAKLNAVVHSLRYCKNFNFAQTNIGEREQNEPTSFLEFIYEREQAENI